MPRRYDAVLFDLLTALLDSWTLWNDVAGDERSGRLWRAEYLRLTYGAGTYRAYEDLVAEAAASAGLSRGLAQELAQRYAELRPWPGVKDWLTPLLSAGVPLAVVTNCSQTLGQVAAGCVGVRFDAVITAERAGFYKPDPRPYRLALAELGVAPDRSLFVAGSPYDLVGASRVDLDVWWHDRSGMQPPAHAPSPLRRTADLKDLAQFVLNA